MIKVVNGAILMNTPSEDIITDKLKLILTFHRNTVDTDAGVTENETLTEKQAIHAIQSILQAREQQLLTELLGELPTRVDLASPLQQSWKLGGTDEQSYIKGFEWYHRQVASLLNAKLKQTNDGGEDGNR